MHAVRLLITSLCLIAAPVVFAHSDEPSHEHTVGKYLVDVGYNTATPTAGDEVLFNFDLYTGTGDDLLFAPFDNVVFTVTRGKSLTAEKTIQNIPPNVPTLRYAFPAIDTYEITVAYNKHGVELVRDAFALSTKAPVPELQAEESASTGFVESAVKNVFLTDALIAVVVGVVIVCVRRLFRQ